MVLFDCSLRKQKYSLITTKKLKNPEWICWRIKSNLQLMDPMWAISNLIRNVAISLNGLKLSVQLHLSPVMIENIFFYQNVACTFKHVVVKINRSFRLDKISEEKIKLTIVLHKLLLQSALYDFRIFEETVTSAVFFFWLCHCIFF